MSTYNPVLTDGLDFDVTEPGHTYGAFGHVFTLDPDGVTIHFTADTGTAGHVRSANDMGNIFGFGIYSERLLIVREMGFETLQVTVDPARFRLKQLPARRVVGGNVVNLNQLRFKINAMKRRKRTW